MLLTHLATRGLSAKVGGRLVPGAGAGAGAEALPGVVVVGGRLSGGVEDLLTDVTAGLDCDDSVKALVVVTSVTFDGIATSFDCDCVCDCEAGTFTSDCMSTVYFLPAFGSQ